MRAFLDDIAELERRKITCQPIPNLWSALGARTDIHWQRFPFVPGATNQIPREPGFFCFFVGDPPATLPAIGFPLYFGRTERTLRRRFATYVNEQQDAGLRPQVRDFLEVFEGELTFLCSPFDGTPEQMNDLARVILDALRPAFSDSGYEAEAQPGQGAW